MAGIRRATIAVGIGAVLAAVLRLRGSAPVPPGTGGWRDLDRDELLRGTEGSGEMA